MHWPTTAITFRGDSHYGRKEVMAWFAHNDVAYIFGFAPNKVLAEQVFPKLAECRVRRALAQAEKVRDFTVTRYAAKSWSRDVTDGHEPRSTRYRPPPTPAR
jgi:hypothetical protein